MIGAIMLYVTVTTALLGAASALGDWACASRRLPRRSAWAIALGMSLVFLLAALRQGHHVIVAGPSPVLAPITAFHASSTSLGNARGWFASLPGAAKAAVWRIDESASALASFDRLLMWGWVAASTTLVLLLITAQLVLARRAQRWRTDRVQGTSVLVAPDDGPALIGVRAPLVVLPEWALALPPAAVALMIRHEDEHRQARDPILMRLAGLVLLAMPWNVAAWWMVGRLRLAVEFDCDARVLAATGGKAVDATAYGQVLLEVAARRSLTRSLASPAMLGHTSMLTRRIAAMFPGHGHASALRAATTLAGAVALALLAFVLPSPRLRAQDRITAATPITLTAPAQAPEPSPAPPPTELLPAPALDAVAAAKLAKIQEFGRQQLADEPLRGALHERKVPGPVLKLDSLTESITSGWRRDSGPAGSGSPGPNASAGNGRRLGEPSARPRRW